MKTLQTQYNLIKEGKGDKQHFLKQAILLNLKHNELFLTITH